jgi:hypothetical protein
MVLLRPHDLHSSHCRMAWSVWVYKDGCDSAKSGLNLFIIEVNILLCSFPVVGQADTTLTLALSIVDC